MRKIVRNMLLWLLAGCLGSILFSVFAEFFIKWAEEAGWYSRPSERASRVVSAVVSFLSSTWFTAATAFIGGLTAGVWLDWLLRKLEKDQPLALRWKQFSIALIPPTGLASACHLRRDNGGVYRITHMIGVRNDFPDHKTLRYVQGRVSFDGLPRVLSLYGEKSTSVDLVAGVPAFFEIGYVIKMDCDARLDGFEEVSADSLREMIALSRRPSFWLTDSSNGINTGFSSHNNAVYHLKVTFTAEGIEPLGIFLRIDPDAPSHEALTISSPGL